MCLVCRYFMHFAFIVFCCGFCFDRLAGPTTENAHSSNLVKL